MPDKPIHIPGESWREVKIGASESAECAGDTHAFPAPSRAEPGEAIISVIIGCPCGEQAIKATPTSDGGWDVALLAGSPFATSEDE